jgi:hypothetical protein
MTDPRKNSRYYPADEYAETTVLDDQSQGLGVSIEVERKDRAPSEDRTEEVRTLSVQELERLLKANKRTN